MESNYLKKAQPHKGAYRMHMNEILVNVTAYLEKWADEYVPAYKKRYNNISMMIYARDIRRATTSF